MKQTLCRLFFLGFLLAAAAITPLQLNAQNRPVRGEGGIPGLGRALTIDITAIVTDDEDTELFNKTQSNTTIPGRPVGINLKATNVIIAVQFTPFIRRSNNVLVVQSQIWIEDPEKGISYYTSIQTIPMEFEEPIHFFPLGTSEENKLSMEMIITVSPFAMNNEQ